MWLNSFVPYGQKKKNKEKTQALKLLAWEWKLEQSDPRSWPWFHGPLPRAAAEEKLKHDGDFLVRKTGSVQSGEEFVLSCRWKKQNIHYIIRKVLFYPGTVNEVAKYRLEDDCYDTIADLVTAYKGGAKPLSSISKAIISKPITREEPLTKIEKDLAKTLKKKKKLTPALINSEHSDYAQLLDLKIIGDSDSSDEENSEDVADNAAAGEPENETKSEEKDESEDIETILSEAYDKLSVHEQNLVRDEVSTSESTLKTEHSDDGATAVELDSRFHSLPKLNRGFDEEIVDCRRTQSAHCLTDEEPPPLNAPVSQLPTFLYKPQLMENIFYHIETARAHVLALNLTYVDLGEFGLLEQYEQGEPIFDGFELMLLPQGGAYRRHLMNRFELVKGFVSTTIELCPGDEERFVFLKKWIDVAVDLKTSIGNGYSFHSIMSALSTVLANPAFETTWELLRATETRLALNFETQLMPILHRMEQGQEPVPPNTCIPDICHIVKILDANPELSNDLGSLSSMLDELVQARSWSKKVVTFRKNVTTLTRNFRPMIDVISFLETGGLVEFFQHTAYFEALQNHVQTGEVLPEPERETEL